MTIADRLHVSILSAPVAAADRRALSQAWYSALYHSKTRARSSAPLATHERPHKGGMQRAAVIARDARAGKTAANVPRSAQLPRRAEAGAAPERRSPRSALARKIEAAFLRPGVVPRTATFTLGEHGRVRISLRMDGATACLIAVCAPNARAKVAHALAQARYALALHGVYLSSVLEERAQ